MMSLPLLSLMLLLPLLAVVIIWLLPRPILSRWLALFAMLATLALAVVVTVNFQTGQSSFQFVEQHAWIATLHVQYRVGVDGISVLFLPLTALLFAGVILGTWHSVQQSPRLFYSLILLLATATLGIFMALDLILFFLFWELTLLPLLFLISLWGVGPNRRYAAMKYTLLMLTGGVPVLLAFVLLGLQHADSAGVLSFDYRALLELQIPPQQQTLIFFLLLIGFAFKAPLFPLHTWLPVTAMQGPAAVTATLVGLKLGVYAMLRFIVPLTPQALLEQQVLLMSVGAIGLIYGALAALAQTNLRRMLAFSSISHVGMVIMAIATLEESGLTGAVMQLLNFVIIAGGLMLLTGMLQHRTGSVELLDLGGVARGMPRLAALYLLLGLASLGVPGTSGFIGELLMFIGIFTASTGGGVVALIGLILSAAYFLHFYRRAFLGPVRNPVFNDNIDLGTRELLVFIVIIAIILVLGIYPAPVVEIIHSSRVMD